MKASQRYRGTLAYNGIRYQGFQRQAHGIPTIQGELEAAIEAVTQQAVTIIGAGRTDTGVHARGQVIAFDCEWRHSPATLCRAINAHLPRDIVLREVGIAEASFHPRFDAVSREYLYQFYTAPVHDPLWDMASWHVGSQVDLAAMQAAAQVLIGKHDFATFGQAPVGTNTVREIYRALFAAEEAGQYQFVIEGNAFLTHMVRSLMGTLVEVGQSKRSVEQFAEDFAAHERKRAAPNAPPHGLILVSVSYRGETALEFNNESQNLDTESE